MHELSIAQNIIDTIILEAHSKKASRVTEIDLDIGELMQLDTKVLRDGVMLLLPNDPLLRGARVRFYKRKASFQCRKCDSKLSFKDAQKQLAKVSDQYLIREPDSKELPLHFFPYLFPTFLHCSNCGSSDIQISSGAEDIEFRKLILE
jgi:Zn finger protein HypA/HybF involved in hydrogenase expression